VQGARREGKRERARGKEGQRERGRWEGKGE